VELEIWSVDDDRRDRLAALDAGHHRRAGSVPTVAVASTFRSPAAAFARAIALAIPSVTYVTNG
jgi:hypothetical protein